MQSIKYFRNRIEFAVKNNGTIKINNQDIEAINKLIEWEANQYRNTELEDSLLLFYLLNAYKVSNVNNRAKIEEKGIDKVTFPLGVNNAYDTLKGLSEVLDPKQYIIQKIADELFIYQEYERLALNMELRQKEMNADGEYTEDEIGIRTHKLTHQETRPLNMDELITYEEVEEMLEKLLKDAKNTIPKLKALSVGKFKQTTPLNSKNTERWRN